MLQMFNYISKDASGITHILSQTHTREEPIQVAYVLPKGSTPNRQLRGFVLKGYGTEGIRGTLPYDPPPP